MVLSLFWPYYLQVDVLIDLCDELHNIRGAAAEGKRNLESISEDYLVEVSIVLPRKVGSI